MKDAIKAIAIVFTTALAVIFGLLSKLYNNRTRTNRIRNGIDKSKERSDEITSGIVEAQGTASESRKLNQDARESTGEAIEAVTETIRGIDNTFRIIQKVRERGQINSGRANVGNSDT
jgi:methyl-accepting chemotaxis protein